MNDKKCCESGSEQAALLSEMLIYILKGTLMTILGDAEDQLGEVISEVHVKIDTISTKLDAVIVLLQTAQKDADPAKVQKAVTDLKDLSAALDTISAKEDLSPPSA